MNKPSVAMTLALTAGLAIGAGILVPTYADAAVRQSRPQRSRQRQRRKKARIFRSHCARAQRGRRR